MNEWVMGRTYFCTVIAFTITLSRRSRLYQMCETQMNLDLTFGISLIIIFADHRAPWWRSVRGQD